jgi:hypothetical protein
VGVKTLEVLTAARAGDPHRKLGPEPALLGVGALEARAELVVLLGLAGVALDSSLGSRREMPATSQGRSDRRWWGRAPRQLRMAPVP